MSTTIPQLPVNAPSNRASRCRENRELDVSSYVAQLRRAVREGCSSDIRYAKDRLAKLIDGRAAEVLELVDPDVGACQFRTVGRLEVLCLVKCVEDILEYE